MQKVWKVKKPNIELQKVLAEGLNIPTLLAQILINRGITSCEEALTFLGCQLSSLYDPFLLKDMDKAVSRIKDAVKNKEKITVWGDYDVDGLTSIALLMSALERLGAEADYYVPHRVDEGYGLNSDGVEALSEKDTKLLITVDCGIGGAKEVRRAKSLGIDTIITDHHRPQGAGPEDAAAVINPLQKGCDYPFKYLAGVGLAFKLAWALLGRPPEEELDLAALGTISDIAPMSGENRILVKYGLRRLSRTKRPGLKALMDAAGLKNKAVTSAHAGFILGPRLNATGRIGSSESSIKLLLAKDYEEALGYAMQLNEDNRSRQKLESKTLQEALAKIDTEINFKHHKVIVLHSDDWHPGVIGIVASRIVERFYRPTILFSFKEGKVGKGSGRSIESFHLFEALANCEDFIEEFGGHKRACGLSVRQERFAAFRQALNDYAMQTITPADLNSSIDIDADIPLSALSEKLISQIEKLGPFGPENPRPVFASRSVALKGRPQIAGKDTVKMWVSDGDLTCQAVGFGMADAFAWDSLPETINIAYAVSINEWQGARTMELRLKDVQDSPPVEPLRRNI